MAGGLTIGLAMMIAEDFQTGEKVTWEATLAMARRAEDMGLDTLWIPDELLWRAEDWDTPRGWWDCVAISAAVAASTSTISIGTWVLSALHRNPGVTAKAIETIDEISGGRAIFGFGAGHAGVQGENFGFPLDKTIGRYAEALEIVIPLLRHGNVDYSGTYHQASNLEHRPHGPRPGQIPILLAGHGPRTIGLAARYADIWSGYATGSSLPEAYVERIQILDEACAGIGRDPTTIGRSVSALVTPTGAPAPEFLGVPVTGSAEQMAETLAGFTGVGVTSVELWLHPYHPDTLEAMAPVLEMLRS